jgi:hypothetical protein
MLLIGIILFSQGIRHTDADYPELFNLLIHFDGSQINPQRGFLLEGLLGDLIGILYLSVDLKATIAQHLWWITGVILLIIILVLNLRNKSIDAFDLILIVAFTRLIDTLSLWEGKFDPFLLSALILSSSNRHKIALSGIVLASFFHPFLAIISTAGVVVTRAAFEGFWFRSAIVAVLISSFLDLTLFHLIFPMLPGRVGYMTTSLSLLLNNAMQWGFSTFVGSIIVPFMMLAYFKEWEPIRDKHYQILLLIAWTLLVAILSCILTLDHTRVSCLLTIAPAMVFLRSRRQTSIINSKEGNASLVFVIFLLARLVIPHIAGSGTFLFFNWETLGKTLRAIL